MPYAMTENSVYSTGTVVFSKTGNAVEEYDRIVFLSSERVREDLVALMKRVAKVRVIVGKAEGQEALHVLSEDGGVSTFPITRKPQRGHFPVAVKADGLRVGTRIVDLS